MENATPLPPPLVVFPAAGRKAQFEALFELRRQWPDVTVAWIDTTDPYSYANHLRKWFAYPGVTVICEHDVIPPPGSIRALIECPAPWCAHPNMLGHGPNYGTLALCKWGAQLKAEHPDLAWQALARPGRRGKRQACWPADQPPPWDAMDGATWPTTSVWECCDSHLLDVLDHRGLRVHTHPEIPRHLHDYRR